MISAKNISLNIDGAKLLDGVNVSAGAGEFVALAGANGAGKTLLLKTLCGLQKPTRGEVLLKEKNINLYNIRQRAEILRFMPALQESAFNYKAFDIVLTGTNPLLDWWQNYGAPEREKAAGAMKLTGSFKYTDREIFTLSRGEQQRVFIARGIVSGPKIILCDEPSSHLDLKQKNDIFKLFKKLADGGAAIVCATHDIDLIKKYCTRVCFLKYGKIFFESPAGEIPENIINFVYNIDSQTVI